MIGCAFWQFVWISGCSLTKKCWSLSRINQFKCQTRLRNQAFKNSPSTYPELFNLVLESLSPKIPSWECQGNILSATRNDSVGLQSRCRLLDDNNLNLNLAYGILRFPGILRTQEPQQPPVANFPAKSCHLIKLCTVLDTRKISTEYQLELELSIDKTSFELRRPVSANCRIPFSN